MQVIVSAREMAAADSYTIETQGVSGIELMERASRACAEILLEITTAEQLIAVVAGPGNNGGDGLAIARILSAEGRAVSVFLACPLDKLKGDALTNYQRLAALGHTPEIVADAQSLALPKNTAWVVDALLGTGLTGPAREPAATLIEKINAHPARVLAVDLPSGLCGDDGRILGNCIRADLTVTFQNMKFAHAVTPACDFCGRVIVREIGIHFDEDNLPGAYFLEAHDYERPARPLQSHKGSFGTLGIIGGFVGMQGAANLAGMAALRFGAGKVRIFSDVPGQGFHHDSLMVNSVASLQTTDDLDNYQALVIGPGMGRNPGSYAHLDRLDLATIPVVWDADGLEYLRTRPTVRRGSPWVMTPHPGEAAALLGTKPLAIQADRLGAIEALAAAFPGGWILLKGRRTLIRSPRGPRYVCATGNAALATAGSGDVLSGMIGALLAAGQAIEDAVLLACLRHGLAADRWVEHYRDYSMLAEDIIEDLKY